MQIEYKDMPWYTWPSDTTILEVPEGTIIEFEKDERRVVGSMYFDLRDGMARGTDLPYDGIKGCPFTRFQLPPWAPNLENCLSDKNSITK